jgi:MFS family permease
MSAPNAVIAAESTHAVVTAIQLALTPVFLLMGIGGILNVISGRLSRIVDRGRALAEGRRASLPAEALAIELKTLERRRRWTSVAMAACTVAALLVCAVIAALFVEAMFSAPLEALIGALFTGATVTLMIGLAFFMREVHVATNNRIRTPGDSLLRSDRGSGVTTPPATSEV